MWAFDAKTGWLALQRRRVSRFKVIAGEHLHLHGTFESVDALKATVTRYHETRMLWALVTSKAIARIRLPLGYVPTAHPSEPPVSPMR